ncbi:hypothetical protein I4F81_002523 [Pyropia yezoensis]|uniref:Uncharacterized protein n=1 Tax=Pyropia yezoensis TaxID=2788 RepID=A0ACC3BQD9_PYRYE|nr:hypothetical protein I4F81_002523 [Neopyropia yezoensis]
MREVLREAAAEAGPGRGAAEWPPSVSNGTDMAGKDGGVAPNGSSTAGAAADAAAEDRTREGPPTMVSPSSSPSSAVAATVGGAGGKHGGAAVAMPSFLQCPECAAVYVVDGDELAGVEMTVACSTCAHQWHAREVDLLWAGRRRG